MNVTTLEPVRKSVKVALDPEAAFRLFTERTIEWWPTETHALAEGRVSDVVFEQHAGGAVYEIADDGTSGHWATVLVWEPPARFVLSWEVSPTRPANTEVEVCFSAVDDGTRVDLEHRGWERWGERALEGRADYDSGWDVVLGRYAAAGT